MTTAPPSTPVLFQSTDDAAVSGDFASDGTGVGVPNGTGFSASPSGSGSAVTFTFQVSEAGTYAMQGSVLAPDGADDSFWVTVNGQPSAGWLWDTGRSTSYLPSNVSNRNGDNPQLVDLGTGTTTVTVHLREDGTYIRSMELIRQ